MLNHEKEFDIRHILKDAKLNSPIAFIKNGRNEIFIQKDDSWILISKQSIDDLTDGYCQFWDAAYGPDKDNLNMCYSCNINYIKGTFHNCPYEIYPEKTASIEDIKESIAEQLRNGFKSFIGANK